MLKAAVIGVGLMGRNHVRVYAEMEEVELVAVADTDIAPLEKVCRTYRLPAYSDYVEMLDKEKPEVVSVTVPTQFHCEVALEAIARGIHVLVEKPLALSIEEGMKLIDAAARLEVKLTVGHIERFNPAVIEVKKRLKAQELGQVFKVHARRLSPFPRRIQDVGVVLDLATHDIDVMRYLLLSEVSRVYAEIESKAESRGEDLVSGLLRFENGILGVLDVNWLTPTKVRDLAVLGERGMYLLDYLTQDLYWFKNADTPESWNSLYYFSSVGEGDMVKVLIEKKEPLKAELESFVAAVIEDSEPPVSGEDGLRALELAQKLIESGRSHRPVYLETKK